MIISEKILGCVVGSAATWVVVSSSGSVDKIVVDFVEVFLLVEL